MTFATFSKLTFIAVALSALVAATDCTSGTLMCCNALEPASDPSVATLLNLLGIVLQDQNVLIGVGCSPISVIGVGGASCSSVIACCQDTYGNVLVPLCVPATL